MELHAHLEIGMIALTRGFVDLKRLASLLAQLSKDSVTPEDFWLQPNLLTRAQLDEVKHTVAMAQGSAASQTSSAPRSFRSIGTDAMTAVVATPPPMPPGSHVGRPSEMFHAATPPAAEVKLDGGAVSPRQTGDRYMRLATLGTGGMGEVVACIDLELGRRVAVKSLRPDFFHDLSAARMLEREARVTGSLEHPNIVPVYDVGTHPKLGPFYVMRIVEQPSLSQVLVRLRDGEADAIAAFSQGRLLRHFIQICETVDYAHSRGVVHCDLKPANVLIGSFGEVIVVDWGLAFRLDEGTSYRGGTPGYMAPEQLDETHTQPIDARTDVYALGVILYEMLALEPYAEAPVTTLVHKSSARRKRLNEPIAPRSPQRPSARSPERRIAAELDEICLRALAEDPSSRFQTARQMAQAIEAFLEGTKEKERRQRRADELAEDGDRLADSYREFLESRPERLAELALVRAQLAPWEPAERKRALWDEEDRIAVTDALGVRTLQAAIHAYDQALDEVGSHPAARRGLARLYQAQLERAQERGDDLDRIYFEELVKQYDDGTIAKVMWGEGRLRLEIKPPGMISLALLEEKDRHLVATREIAPGCLPEVGLALPPGRYGATVLVEGKDIKERVVRFPLHIRAGRELSFVVDLESAGEPGEGEVLVPGGPALLGGDPTSAASAREIDVASFFMAAQPVSFREYLEFLIAMQTEDPSRAGALAPRTRDGAHYFRWDGEAYVPARILAWGGDAATALSLPVFGVDAVSAMAYAEWRSTKDGRRYRLPTDEEWEKAGRGTDGRLYPWGDHFDASFCKMRQARPGMTRPEPPGAFPIDQSPYGVIDLAGGVADWVIPSGPELKDEHGVRLMSSRGGAWSDWAADCSLTARRPYLAVERSSRVGFRLARSVML